MLSTVCAYPHVNIKETKLIITYLGGTSYSSIASKQSSLESFRLTPFSDQISQSCHEFSHPYLLINSFWGLVNNMNSGKLG